ncbi:activator-dependent family glycosyltransferase [Nocardiopsis sediminis]|uniref:Activator-dependent family glycosyltransferase n=1 Tax=Nocardiopsis sediminis TaxID=1778267 RepID=A0ABV8FF58_9ACTN
MRILFATISVKSHFYGMVPLAWAFRAAGHEVRVASQPELAETIAHTGLPAVAVGGDIEVDDIGEASAAEDDEPVNIFDADPATLGWAQIREGYDVMTNMGVRQINEPMLDGLVEFARAWRPDLVIWEPLTYAGAVAARACGAAHARMLWGLDIWAPVRERFRELRGRQPAGQRSDAFTDWLTQALRRHGCSFDEEAVTGQWTIDPLPAPVRTRSGSRTVPVRYVPFNGPAAVPDWLTAPPERPRVCLTMGLSGREYDGYFSGPSTAAIADVLRTVGALDVELVATLSADQVRAVGEIPDGVRVVDFVPLDALLPTCSAVIHHGGAGSFSTALVNGVPQLLFTKMFDTRLKGDRITALGAGAALPSAGFAAADVGAAVTRMLEDPSFAEGAGRLRDEMLAYPSPAELVPILEKLTRDGRCGG